MQRRYSNLHFCSPMSRKFFLDPPVLSILQDVPGQTIMQSYQLPNLAHRCSAGRRANQLALCDNVHCSIASDHASPLSAVTEGHGDLEVRTVPSVRIERTLPVSEDIGEYGILL
jgi:hypothetical protein